MKTVGGVAFPGSPLAATRAELEQLAGYWPDIEKSRAEARRLLKEAGAEGLTFELLNRNVDQPYKFNALWVIDEWSKIGVKVTQRVVPTGPFGEALRRGGVADQRGVCLCSEFQGGRRRGRGFAAFCERRALALADSGRAQCREIIANALGVDAEVAPSIARSERRSMRLSKFVGATRTTISSVKPIQRLRWLASIWPADLSDATIVQPICWAVSSARANATSGPSPTLSGKMFG
jgi:hypothetical protein